jgi:hypothetical protein
MSPTHTYDEVLDFLTAKMTPEEIANFRPSPEAQARFSELIARKKTDSITSAETEELEEFLRLEHFMIMAKARAQLRAKATT